MDPQNKELISVEIYDNKGVVTFKKGDPALASEGGCKDIVEAKAVVADKITSVGFYRIVRHPLDGVTPCEVIEAKLPATGFTDVVIDEI